MYLFDLDGTLIDSNGIWASVDRAFLARRGFAYTKEYYEGVAHTIFPIAAEFTKKYCRLEESCEEIMAEWKALAGDAYAHTSLKPFVREYLDTLRDAGERMVVFTNAVPAHCEIALQTHGLTDCFEQVLYAQTLGVDKGNPNAFRMAAEVLQVAPEDCVLVDDSLKSCRNAKAIGMRVIGVYDPFFDVCRDEMPEVCDRYIQSFSELLV